jgi:AraC-like DNA-binding protein
MELTALALGASDDAKHAIQSSGLRAARRQVILDEISRRFLVPGLTSESIAAAVGISERYLRALLDDIGTTFSDVVLEHRLERAHDLLTDPRRHSELITDIAYEAGFSDLSYFNRAFRRRYNATPRDVRAEAFKL